MNDVKRSRARTILFGCLSTLLGIAIPLALLEMGLRFLPVGTGLRAVEVNESNPVSTFTPNREYIWSKGWNFSIVNKGRVNKNGFVSDLDYDETLNEPPLIAVIGDSFVEAQMVPYQETIQGRLARRLGDRARVYSFAAGGAPLSQYLAYAEHAGLTYAPVAMITVITDNDFDESVLKYRGAPSFHYFVEGTSGEFELTRVDYKPSLTRRILRHSALVRYLVYHLNLANWVEYVLSGRQHDVQTEDAERQRIADSIRAIDAFLEQMPARSRLPESQHLFVIDGIRPNLYSPDGLAEAAGSYYDLMRRHFIDAAQQRGYEIIDMQPVFVKQYQQDGLRFEFPTDYHWNGHGHGVAADAIASSRFFARALDNPD